MVKPEELVAAGAYISIEEKLKSESTVDTVSARRFQHAALGDRAVVRLSADCLAEGDDLTMEFLGFGKPVVQGPIAKRQRQSLGFPGWAIVNDPPHARYALELVKEFKKAVRKSKSKPGFGYDEFTEIAKRLGKSVAHFLPSFWEQAGREFIALDNATYGSRAFGKAREAEKIHALKVDESLRQDAFLEFALAGAVSIKALTEYGKELLSTHDPAAAWKFFRELCVRRTLGGMPPWTSMVKDLQPLMKAAGLNIEHEVQAILVEIIDSPAISRAAMAFWDSASKFIGPLVKRDNHVAGVLLNLIPQTSSWRNDDVWPWLTHLQSWGILSNAWRDDVESGAGPDGGPAAWLTRLLRNIDRPRQVIYDILQEMAPRLVRDEISVDLFTRNRWNQQVSADVDLLDLALELNVPFLEVPADLTVDLRLWASPIDDAKDLRNRPRDPVKLFSDLRFRPAILKAVEIAAGDSTFETVATGKVALGDARRSWLLSLIDGINSGGLPLSESSLKILESNTRRAIFAEFPDALEKLKAVNLLPSVARTLRGGIYDEYGWPNLESQFEKFISANQAAPLVFGHFPYIILTDKLKAVVLKGEEVVHETELKLQKGDELKNLMYLDGDLLVCAGPGYNIRSFWNSDPQPSEPGYLFYVTPVSGVTIDVPGGGTFIGDKIIHKGAKVSVELQATDSVLCDGNHWWTRIRDYDQLNRRQNFFVVEIDPKTGKSGRKSLPTFLEDFIQDGTELDVFHSSLLPVGDDFPESPLGVKQGLSGSRIRRSSNQTLRIEGIDGRSAEVAGTYEVDFLLALPAAETFLPVQSVRQYRQSCGLTVWDSTGKYALMEYACGGDAYSRGQVTSIPAIFLHEFEVRDLATSKKLRSLTDSEVGLLLSAEQQDFETFLAGKSSTLDLSKVQHPGAQTTGTNSATASNLRDETTDSKSLNQAITQVFGECVHPRLQTGLRGLLIRAGQKKRQLAKLVDARMAEPSSAPAAVETAAADAAIAPYLSTLRNGFRSLSHLSFLESAARAADFLTGKSTTLLYPEPWFENLRMLSQGVAQRVWVSYCIEPEAQSWAAFAESWSHSPFYQLPGWFRVFTGENHDTEFLSTEKAAVKAIAQQSEHSQVRFDWVIPYTGKKNRFLIFRNYNGYQVLEYSADGTFESIPGLVEIPKLVAIVPPTVWSPEQLRKFVTLARNSTLPYPSLDVLKSLAADVKASVGELALVWFGLPKFDDYSSNFMPTHLRESCKLKTKDCSAARESLKALPVTLLNKLVRSVVDGDPEDLWEKPPIKVADRIRAAWKGDQPDRIELDSEWLEKLSDSLGYHVDKQRFFEALNSPQTHPLFSDRSEWKFGKGRYSVELVCTDHQNSFSADVLYASGLCLTMLAYGLPVGHSARQKMVDLYAAVQKALANPNLLLRGGTRYEFQLPKGTRLSELVETTVCKPQKRDDYLIADDGGIVVLCEQNPLQIAFRPSHMKEKTQADRMLLQLKALTAPSDGEETGAPGAIENVLLFRSPDFRQIADRIQSTPVPPGLYESNPVYSAPDLVAEVAKKWSLTSEAATYYLQLLTLADPTDKNIMLWNSWTTTTIKKLGAELIEKKLVLEASRSRAGRKYFLPGGWEDLKVPHLPLETWKVSLFRMTRDSYQRATPPLGRIVPLEPVHSLFVKAWQRILDGDVPRYEEVK